MKAAPCSSLGTVTMMGDWGTGGRPGLDGGSAGAGLSSAFRTSNVPDSQNREPTAGEWGTGVVGRGGGLERHSDDDWGSSRKLQVSGDNLTPIEGSQDLLKSTPTASDADVGIVS